VLFHALTSLSDPVPAQIGVASVATIADYLVNITSVTMYTVCAYRLPPYEVIRKLRVGQLGEFGIGYLGLGLMGVVVAHLYASVGFWSVAAFLTPVVIARQLFFRSKALEEAHVELQAREQVPEQLSTRM